VEVVVKQGGKVVRVIDTKTNKSITLNSGVYELELDGGTGLKLSLDKATLTRGDTSSRRWSGFRRKTGHFRRGPSPPVLSRTTGTSTTSPSRRTGGTLPPSMLATLGGERHPVGRGDRPVRPQVPDIGWGRVEFTADGKRLVVLLAKSLRVFDVATAPSSATCPRRNRCGTSCCRRRPPPHVA